MVDDWQDGGRSKRGAKQLEKMLRTTSRGSGLHDGRRKNDGRDVCDGNGKKQEKRDSRKTQKTERIVRLLAAGRGKGKHLCGAHSNPSPHRSAGPMTGHPATRAAEKATVGKTHSVGRLTEAQPHGRRQTAVARYSSAASNDHSMQPLTDGRVVANCAQSRTNAQTKHDNCIEVRAAWDKALLLGRDAFQTSHKHAGWAKWSEVGSAVRPTGLTMVATSPARWGRQKMKSIKPAPAASVERRARAWMGGGGEEEAPTAEP
ncbi:unnamed protein product [Pleuronectes platessa]|uniref:Uncharacterized protein n=1 Tax=Pleuronectes platessa TaxID=8262 RepID=A0A9N7ZCM4_PLEPL|nr:unnamed protein product [Pleuronectes platessa]